MKIFPSIINLLSQMEKECYLRNLAHLECKKSQETSKVPRYNALRTMTDFNNGLEVLKS